MQITVTGQLKAQGFKEYKRTVDAVYMQRGADHRVILQNGQVKRGKLDHRGK